MKIPGFLASAVPAGIKYQNRLDLGLILSRVPAVIAGVFTTNAVKAAPVIAGIERIAHGPSYARAIVVNSGNANACTGDQGMKDVETTARHVAQSLGIEPRDVLVSSTGVIGRPLPMERIKAAIPKLVAGLSEDGLEQVAKAILTTDLVPKTAIRQIRIRGTSVTIGGIAKGSGMIAPSMGPPHATMLAFLMTDADLDPAWARAALARTTDATFNRIIVDGDTSTNDTVLLLANGMARNHPLAGDAEPFGQALHDVCAELARKIVEDGEGATKCVSIFVTGARSDESADAVARAIATSPLVKTAFFGEDPNWGRILAAAGRAETDLDQTRISLSIEDIPIVSQGIGLGDGQEALAKAAMAKRAFTVKIDLGLGAGSAQVVTCDLSADYVRINADYRT
ncbi:MAG: bifunctional glutamate N-acetyltransferase/amino-acid acetyltransferase ArgJ [Deltaproteobacteria bacterium]